MNITKLKTNEVNIIFGGAKEKHPKVVNGAINIPSLLVGGLSTLATVAGGLFVIDGMRERTYGFKMFFKFLIGLSLIGIPQAWYWVLEQTKQQYQSASYL